MKKLFTIALLFLTNLLIAENTKQMDAKSTGASDANSSAHTPKIRASDLIGMNVGNPQNEALGKIKDLAVDLPSGRVNYAVFSTGGFLGLGEKLIALPLVALTFDAETKKLVLNADKESLKNAAGFHEKQWPDVAEQNWRGDMNDGRVEIYAAENGTLRIEEPAGSEFKLSGEVSKASEVIGTNVKNPQKETLGALKDFVVDLQSGEIAYAALSFGGILGFGEKLIALSPQELSRSEDKKLFVLNRDKASLQHAEGFDKNKWPATPQNVTTNS